MLCSTNNEMDKIDDNIWLGDYKAAINITNLKKEGIQKILCVMDNQAPKYNEENNFNRKIIEVADSPTVNIIKYFGECIDFMKGDEKVLVHCMGGASRSAAIVIAYIMWKEKKKFADALDYVSKKRSCVFPNGGFKKQLKKFELLLEKNNYDLSKIDFKSIEWKAKFSDFF